MEERLDSGKMSGFSILMISLIYKDAKRFMESLWGTTGIVMDALTLVSFVKVFPVFKFPLIHVAFILTRRILWCGEFNLVVISRFLLCLDLRRMSFPLYGLELRLRVLSQKLISSFGLCFKIKF